jgi:Holliday junction resolvase RusA-like endonuclease
MPKPKANNYFHVRVYTDDGAKIEIFRDRKQPSTRREIIDGMKRGDRGAREDRRRRDGDAAMTALQFRVLGVAQQMGSKRAFVPKGWLRPIVTDSNRNLKSWQALVAEAAGQAVSAAGWALLDAPVRLWMAFYLPRPASLPKRVVAMTKAPDTSKLIRAAEDALTGIVYRDDVLVCEIVAGKYYAAAGEVPHCDIRVEPTQGVRPYEPSAAPGPLFEQPLFSMMEG